MSSVLSAVDEIERENIRVQTMEGRIQKVREGTCQQFALCQDDAEEDLYEGRYSGNRLRDSELRKAAQAVLFHEAQAGR